MRRLTAKQELFCQEVVKNGGNKLEAYKASGYSHNMAPDKMAIQADKTYNKPNVSLRVKELQDAADKIAVERFSISVEERLRRLDHIYHCGIEKNITPTGETYQSLSTATKSIEVMNAMLGIDERSGVKPVKVVIGVEDAS